MRRAKLPARLCPGPNENTRGAHIALPPTFAKPGPRGRAAEASPEKLSTWQSLLTFVLTPRMNSSTHRRRAATIERADVASRYGDIAAPTHNGRRTSGYEADRPLRESLELLRLRCFPLDSPWAARRRRDGLRVFAFVFFFFVGLGLVDLRRGLLRGLAGAAAAGLLASATNDASRLNTS